MKRIPNVSQTKQLEDWRDRDEPTSDLYRLSGPSKNKKLKHPEEYRGTADLKWKGPTPQNYEAERRRRQLV